tara:strand:+ start:452 stop:826 length:375 start_codon:yes stop_codon:yes gene_type:complete
MKKIIKKILKESDFDWTKDIGYESEEEGYIIEILNSCKKVPFDDVISRGFVLHIDRMKVFLVDTRSKEIVYTDKILPEMRKKFGIFYGEQKEVVKSVFKKRFDLEGYKVFTDDLQDSDYYNIRF